MFELLYNQNYIKWGKGYLHCYIARFILNGGRGDFGLLYNQIDIKWGMGDFVLLYDQIHIKWGGEGILFYCYVTR